MKQNGKPLSDLRIHYEKYVLPNGLQLILHVDRKLPIAHVNHWFHVGSKNEKPGRTGFAHLFEHLMFEGSKNAPGGYFKYIEEAGGNLREGGVNGTTSYDRTNYFSTVPSGNLEYVLWLDSDRIATLPEAITSEIFENQRDVVRNERRQLLENQPYGRWYALINEHLFPSGHPYSWPVIGSHEDLEAATLDEVTDFFRMFYTPNNLSLVIAGDFDPDKARTMVETYYGALTPGPLLDRHERWIPSLDHEKIVEVPDRVPQTRTHLVWPAPARFEEDEASLDLLASIMGDGLSSRLKKRLIYDRQVCTDVYTFVVGNEIAGFFAVIASIRPDASTTVVEEMIEEEIRRMAVGGPTREELERVRTMSESRFVSGLERIGGFGGKADRLNESNVFSGEPDGYLEEYRRIMNCSGEDIRWTAERWLNNRNRLTLRFNPAAPKPVGRPALDRSRVPAFGADTPFRAPEIQRGRLNNGMEIFVLERRDLPRVSVSLEFKIGAVNDVPGKSGTMQLMGITLDKGTDRHSALTIADRLLRLGVGLQTSVYQESFTVSFDTLSRLMEDATGFILDVLSHPEFPEAEFEREKKRHLDHLAQRESHPQILTSRIAPKLIFGSDHPYGQSVAGFPSSVRQIGRDDIQRSYKQLWNPHEAALVLAGDISLDEATRLADRLLGSWDSGAEAPDNGIGAPDPYPAGFYLIDRPEAPQTMVVQILPAPQRKTPDFHALRLVDTIWGAGFRSRLNQVLREEKGYTYGISSSLNFFGHSGYWKAQTSTQADKTGDTVEELIHQLAGVSGERPVTNQELEEARINRIRGFAQQFETNRRITGMVGGLWSSDIPLSEIQDSVSQIERMTLDAVHAAAERHLRPEKARYLLVGNRALIEAQLAERGIGPVVLLDQEGKPL